MYNLAVKAFTLLGLGDSYGGVINVGSLTVNDPEIMSELMKQRAFHHDKWCSFYFFTYSCALILHVLSLLSGQAKDIEWFYFSNVCLGMIISATWLILIKTKLTRRLAQKL